MGKNPPPWSEAKGSMRFAMDSSRIKYSMFMNIV